ncbi:MAG: Ulilysin, partial [Sphingobacteriaceae bacterium]|nr:Ulilysin [Cytophagaceae bacterium]
MGATWFGTVLFGKSLLLTNGLNTPNPSVHTNFFLLRPSLLPGFLGGCLLTGVLLFAIPGKAQDRCGTVRNDSVLSRRILNWKSSRLRLEEKIVELQRSRSALARGTRVEAVVIRIPVVVHVVHTNSAGVVGGAGNGNISDEQIMSQIQVLNEDYRRKPGTNGFNTNPVGADMELEFSLAARDPMGNPSTGIIRVYSPKAEFDIFGDAQELANLSAWPSDKYLNIWVTSFANSSYLGIAQYPSAGDVGGLDNSEAESAATDGVIIDHRTFGRNTGTATSGVYIHGRTTTHEIGHWLGLIHTWGDAVCGTDYCADTPPAERP